MLNKVLKKWRTSVINRRKSLLDYAVSMGLHMFAEKDKAKNPFHYEVLCWLHKLLCKICTIRLYLICAEIDAINFITQLQRPQLSV